MLAILLQVFIAMFSSFLVVGLTSLYDPSSLGGMSGGYAVGYAGTDSPLADLLEEKGDFEVYHMDLSEAVAALQERRLAAVVYVPDTPPDGIDPVKITLYTLKNDISASVTGVKIREAMEAYEVMLREARDDRLAAEPVVSTFPQMRAARVSIIFVLCRRGLSPSLYHRKHKP